MSEADEILEGYRHSKEKERLREKFAGKAMKAMIKADVNQVLSREAIAMESFRQADSMVEAMFMSKKELYNLEEGVEIEESYVDIVFDGPPSAVAPRFVEVENEEGMSISFGEWLKREDGAWVLRCPKYIETEENLDYDDVVDFLRWITRTHQDEIAIHADWVRNKATKILENITIEEVKDESD